MRESYRQRKHELAAYCLERRMQMNCVLLIDSQRIEKPVTFETVDRTVEALLGSVLKRLRQV